MRILLMVMLLALSCARSNGQVLISLLLGDKLNSGKIEFGLEGGMSLSNLQGVSPTKNLSSFNLGFYFDFQMKNPSWMIHTGVMVKSRLGAKGLSPYSLNDPDLDNKFSSGSIKREFGYFNVPFLMKHKWKNNFFAEGGIMLGLMNKATDEFIATIKKKDDLSYRLNVKDSYRALDAGLMAGVGYRLLGGNGMNIGARYYYGLVNITDDAALPKQYNRSWYFYIDIPVGRGKKVTKAKE